MSAVSPAPKGHPIGFWFFFWGELAERCSYYGMNAILFFYMTEKLGFTDAATSFWQNIFMAGCYLAPLAGGLIADRYLGKYRTIVMFSIPYVIGNALMIIPTVPALVGALVILALGSGVIKPNISTLMGMTYDQQRPGQDRLRSSAFSWFYFAINFGSVISQFSMPLLRDKYGPNAAFLLPTILMAVALTIFALGKRFYAVEVIERHEKTPEEKADQRRILGQLMGVFILTLVFWSVFKHYNNVWMVFFRDHVDTTISVPFKQEKIVEGTETKVIWSWSPGSWEPYRFKPDQFQFLNALFILTLLPTSMLVYRWLERRGIKLRPTHKMQLGFVFVLLTPLLFLACYSLAGTGKAHWSWIVAMFFTITVAEVFISPVGLELAFVAAPKSMKGFITACFLFTIFVGIGINAVVTPLYSLKVDGKPFCTPMQYFGVQAAVAAVAMVAFYFVAKPFNRRLAQQEAQAAG